MANAQSLLRDALELSEEERERLAWTLLDSLHDQQADAEVGVVSAWSEEVRRRLADLSTGRSTARPWDEVESSLMERLGIK
jgi:putative addiction module component (TIGR02574 family)